ncbi:MFS transporter [Paeniglutamicibacter cryotolerans]|uniref:EmrB/QacA subfamily drug resistance transporter n=1 Tax=Paeniglutamicibacter cryotolerans TaxID=670079 RepID=A0A839QT31_9MICC|nr:MFS transporter [Paeniglutamicibacter cryotolerans]MBB2996432.1 EmrB/QacA subfamily drug resistance transporter [Paeniglutamicibacter cryotolerans]
MSDSQTAEGAEADYRPDPARWRVLAVLLVTMFMSLIDVSIVNVVLPSIQGSLGATESEIQWVLTGYALTFGVVLVAAGRAGDVFGRGPLFIFGVALFTLSSVASGLAPNPVALDIARFSQGIGSGLISPQVLGMMQQYFRGAERGRAYGALGTVVGFSVAVGPLIGGLMIQLLGPEIGWRFTFLVNVPVGTTAIVLGLRWFPRPLFTSRKRAGTAAEVARSRHAKDLDPVGTMLLGLGVLTLLLPFVQGRDSPWTWWLLPAGLLVIGLWVGWERAYHRGGRSPMVDLGLFAIRSFSLGTLIAGLYFMGVTSIWVLVAIYVQDGMGLSALQAGLLGLPAALCAAGAAHLAGKRVIEYGRKIVIAGIVCAVFAMASSIVVVQLSAAGRIGIWWLLATLSFAGIAQGAIISPNQALTLMEVPLGQSGSAGGVMQTAQRIGAATGIAVITGIFFAVLAASDWDTAISAGFAAIAVVALATLAVAVADQRRRGRGT